MSRALSVPEGEARPVVAVHMGRMSRVLGVNRADKVAHVQAGIRGADLEAALNRQGFTCGHEPDSIEFSTLGGWIATKSSGMKQNRYGNIESLVVDVRAVTADGRVVSGANAMRTSHGMVELRDHAVGSEGNLFLITSATVRLFRLPDTVRYESILFRTFDDGHAFMHALSDVHSRPASVRLMDNAQLRLGQARSR